MNKLKLPLDAIGDSIVDMFADWDFGADQFQFQQPSLATIPAVVDLPAIALTFDSIFASDSNLDFSQRTADSSDAGDDSFPSAAPASGEISESSDVQAIGASSGASSTSQTSTNGIAIPTGSANEIAFLSGVTATGKIAATSFWTWNGASPASYSSTASDAAKWGSPTLSPTGTPGGTVTYWFDASSNWSATERTALMSGLALWSAEANFNFVLASSASAANFIFYRGADGSAYQTFGTQTSAHVGGSTDGTPGSTGSYIHIDTSVGGFGPIGGAFSLYGGYPYETLVHEEGHMLGLGHAGPYNGNVNAATQQFSAYDTRLWSLMSYIDPWTTSAKYYSSYAVTGTNWGISPDGYYYEPTTPMMLDILAAQQIYGAATSGPLASGGQTFGFHSNVSGLAGQYFDFTINTHPVITIWDGGTHNVLDLSGFTANATISLAPGTFTSSNGEVNNIGIAEGTTIETAIGGSGNDTFIGLAGSHTYVGGAGIDTVVYSAASSGFTLEAYGNTVAALSGSWVIHDHLQTVENIQFTDKTVATSSAAAFDAYEYLASYSDLIVAIGNNPQEAFNHYIDYGYTEGRSLTAFDAWEYLASSPDLIRAYGANPDDGAEHYVIAGYYEGRATHAFDNWEYLASNPSLISSVGTSLDAAAQNYVTSGYNAGQSTNSFDAWDYLASNPSLITTIGPHSEAAAQNYVTSGYNAGLSTNSFDGMLYTASYFDLIAAFGINSEAAEQHFVFYGYAEGRSPDLFNAQQYLANYGDLQAAFGDNPDAAAAQYILYGVSEGRTYHALPGATLGTFVGNSNNNTMTVASGDTMTGGGGSDTFVFNNAPAAPATITDFTHGSDVLQISAAGFGHGLLAGSAPVLVTAADFASALHVGSGGDFIFDNAGPHSGTLYWDATGGSGIDAVPVVQLQHVTLLLPSDLHLV